MQRRSTRSMKKCSSPLALESSKPVRPTRTPRKSNLNNSESESSDSDFVQRKPKKTPRKRKTNRHDSNSESSDNEENFTEKSTKTPKKQRRKITSSSSESDIENYLKPASEIDLNSSFFNSNNKSKDDVPFDEIEKEIFSDIKVTRLSDSDSSEEDESETVEQKNVIPRISINDKPDESEKENLQSWKEGEEIARLNFQRLQDYSKKMEEAKRSVEQYQAKQLQENVTKEEKSEETLNIEDLLAIGESKTAKDELDGEQSASSSVGNVGKDSYSDSEQEDWEEIDEKPKNEEESLIPNTELQITVEMPSNMKKKKGNDLLAAVKRRLNRIRKENQLLIHKVHLLCWIAHGNYVNNILNDENMLALGLSLMPSEKSFPSKRLDLDYLEQILKWYKKTVKLSEKNTPENKSLETLLEDQIENKEAYSKGMLAMIFIVILRSLGIQCRLVLSLQVESLRPPTSDLHFLGNASGSKEQDKKTEKIKDEDKTKSKTSNEKEKSSKKKSEPKTTEDSSKKEKIDKSRKSSMKENNKASESSKDDKKETSIYFKETEKSSERLSKQIDKKDTKTNKEEVKKKDSKLSKTTEKNYNKEVKRSQKDSVANNKNIKSSDNKNNDSEKTKNTTNSRQSLRNKESSKEEAALKEEKSKSKKTEEKSSESKRVTRAKSKSPSVESQSVRSKSASTLKVSLEKIDEEQGKHRSKSSSSTSKAKETNKKKIPQLDGMDDSDDFKGFKEPPQKSKEISGNKFEQFYSEIYNRVSNKPESSKVNLKNLKSSSSNDDEDCKSRKHRRSVKKPTYVENTSFSEDDFEDVSPKKKRKSEEDTPKKSEKEDSDRKEKVNLQKLKDSKTSKSRRSEKKSPQKTMDVKEDIMNLIKGRIQEQKHIDRSKLVKKRKPAPKSDSEDSDYAPEPIKKKYQDSDDEFYPKLKVKKRVQTKEVVKKIKKKKEKPKDKNSRKVISSDSEYTEEEVVVKKEEPQPVKEKKKRGNDLWLEVFLEMEEKWISVDVVYGQAHCVNELYSRASHPVSYVLAWNNLSHVKDITRRYCQNFNTVTRKLRIEAAWWEESLKPFLGPKNARDREEDDELDRQQQEKPLPTTISEYKNHPLYALERHLLKFEALYPPNAAPLGFVRNEPVYSRDCVFICHSRDIWLKQAKVVKRKEQPYKIVKARPKYDKLSNTMITDQNLEIFGPWQVEDYDPPTAENGNVPRNAFGNVDLFKECMLPKKCVHLRLPGLNKTARRLNIDCATAIVGFDFHGGWSHPVYDGFVVCEEFEDELVAAWNIEQEEQERKDQEKYEKRVYGNWKKLIRGLMIRERLKAKYGFGRNEEEGGEEEESDSEPKEKKSKVEDSENKKTAVKKKTRRIMSDSEDD